MPLYSSRTASNSPAGLYTRVRGAVMMTAKSRLARALEVKSATSMGRNTWWVEGV
jgi:hypothetical protein